ncbi:MAG: LysE family translocator [Pseudomonadota bacterium]
MDIQSLAVFGVALLLAAASPGPGIVALVARVLGRGRGGAAAFALGAGLADLVWLAIAVGGLAMVAQTVHWLFLAIKWAGIAYLLWLAWKMWTSGDSLSPDQTVAAGEEAPASLLMAGFALTMANPKVMIFYLALLPSVIEVGQVGLLGYLELCAVVALVLLVVFSAYIVLADRARRHLLTQARAHRVNRYAALAMTGAAGWVATK